MAEIKIEWLSDEHDCELCYTDYADGANVYIDGALMLELEPVAHCYAICSYTLEDIYSEIIRVLGHTLVEFAP